MKKIALFFVSMFLFSAIASAQIDDGTAGICPKDCRLFFDGCNQFLCNQGKKVKKLTSLQCQVKKPTKCLMYQL